jgi:hypothetical protein
VAVDGLGITVRDSAASRERSSAIRAARKLAWRANSTTPALRNSARSTSGTTRRTQ